MKVPQIINHGRKRVAEINMLHRGIISKCESTCSKGLKKHEFQDLWGMDTREKWKIISALLHLA